MHFRSSLTGKNTPQVGDFSPAFIKFNKNSFLKFVCAFGRTGGKCTHLADFALFKLTLSLLKIDIKGALLNVGKRFA